MNPGKRGSSERSGGQKGSDSRRSPAMHERSSGKHSPASSHSPANKCGSIPPLLQNEMSRAAAASFLGNFAGTAAFPPSVWQDLPYLLNLNPLPPSFIPRLPLGLDMFSAPFLHPMPGSASGLFPPGLPLLRPPGSTAGLLHSPYAALFPNVNDIPVHLLPKTDQTGSRPRSAKKTSSLASSSSESDIAARTGAGNHPGKHDTKPSHSRKEFWHSPAEVGKVEMRKHSSSSPIVAKSKQDEVVDIMSYSDCNHDSPLELTVKKSSIVPAPDVGPPKRSSSAVNEITGHDDMNSHTSSELHRVTPCENYPPVPHDDDVECLSFRKTVSDISLNLVDQPTIFSTHSSRTGNFSDAVLEESKDKSDEDRRPSTESMNEARDLTKASCCTGAEFEVPQVSGTAPPRQSIALPPRKRLTRNPEELGLGVPNQSSGSDSPSSASNFRLYWKKFAAKTNLNGQPSHRAFISGGKPVHDCRTYFQKMAAKDACKSGILIGKTFIAGKGKGFFHRAVSRSSPRFSRTEGGTGAPPDGSTSPRVTRSQSKLKQKKSGGSPKSSPTEPPMPVRKSLRKKTANSKYETDDLIKTGGKGSTKKETPPKGGAKCSGKNAERELGKSTKSAELSDNADEEDSRKQAKPYSLRDREEKAKGRGSKAVGKDGVQKPAEGLPQFVPGGISKLPESCLELPERKKRADDSFEEKGIGSSSKHMEHDGKSVSSGVSTCSADVALDPEVLSLPPKFRRAKGKTISTSQSVSSIEDDRSAEGVHKDVKVDLCRAFLDHDHSSHSGCGKSQCLVDSTGKHGETSVENSCEESKLESKSTKIQPETAEAAEQEEVGQTGFHAEEKSSQRTTNLMETEKKVEMEKKLEVVKKTEVEKAPEAKADKPYRSTGGKKSLLYRLSLNSTFDESETTTASKAEVTVAPPSAATQEPVLVSVEKTPCIGKPDVPMTEIDRVIETDKTIRSQVTSVTKENEKQNYEESKSANREEAGDGTKSDFVEAPRTRSILEFPRIHSTFYPSAIGRAFFQGQVVQTDRVKRSSEENSRPSSAVDGSETFPVWKREGTSVAKLGTEMEVSDDILSSHPEGSALSFSAELKPKKSTGSESTEDIPSETKSCVSNGATARSEAAFVQASSDPVPSSNIVSTLVQSSSGSAVKSSRDLEEIPSKKDEFLSGFQRREVTERKLMLEAQRASKKRSLEDTLTLVRSKKLKKGENVGLDQAGKIIPDEPRQQMSLQVDDAQDVPSKDQDTGVGGVLAGAKSSTINPLHFYSHRKTLPPSSSAGLTQTVPPPISASCSEAGHSEVALAGAKKAQDVSVPKQSSRSAGRTKTDISSDLLSSSVMDSEPPVLEKTDFTYMEQFSDISDSDDGENRGPPMLEATSDCGTSKTKPCAGSLAIDKHILFAKIASSALEKGAVSSGSQPDEPSTSDLAKETVPDCETFVDPTSHALIGNASHPLASSSVSHSPTPFPVTHPSAPPSASHSVLPSTAVNHTSAAPSVSRLLKSATRHNNSASKKSSIAPEECATSAPGPTELACQDLPISKEGHHHSNSTLSPGDLESCGIVAPLPGIIKDTGNKKALSKNRDASRRASSGAKKKDDLNLLLQHCKSFSVVVQKIDEKGRKRQRRNDPLLDHDLAQDSCDLEMPAPVHQTTNAKDKTVSEDRTEATFERTVAGRVSTAADRIPAAGRSARVVGEKTASRKQKPRARKEMPKMTEAKEKSGDKIQKDEVKAETKDEGLNLSIYDFDKDSNDEIESPLSCRKELPKKLLPREDSAKPRRPIRLKLHVGEHSPVATATTRGRPLGDEKPESKALKEVQPSTPHSEKSLDSTEKLAVGPTDAMVGHVKCRLVKVGRHQWMSVGDSNAQESVSRGGAASDAKSASSVHEGSDVDETQPETKISVESGKVASKQSRSKTDNVAVLKAGKSRVRSRNEPKKKRGKRATRANVVADDFSVSDNSVPSFSRAESSGALSPNSVMDQASRCSESESVAVLMAGDASNSKPDSKIPDFLDLLFGDDLEGLVSDEVSEAKVLDTEAIVRCAIERANFGNICDSALDDYCETLSPASTFFVPSEIETQLAKMTLSDHPRDLSRNTNSTSLSLSKPLAATSQPVEPDMEQIPPTTRNLAPDDFILQSSEENRFEVDRLLTQTSTSIEDGEDDLKNQFGDELMEEFVSWFSPKWDETSLQDFEDPLNSLNLLSPFADSPKMRQKLHV